MVGKSSTFNNAVSKSALSLHLAYTLDFVILDLHNPAGRKCEKHLQASVCVLPVGTAWGEPWCTSAPEIHPNCPLCHKAGRGHLYLDITHSQSSFDKSKQCMLG